MDTITITTEFGTVTFNTNVHVDGETQDLDRSECRAIFRTFASEYDSKILDSARKMRRVLIQVLDAIQAAPGATGDRETTTTRTSVPGG